MREEERTKGEDPLARRSIISITSQQLRPFSELSREASTVVHGKLRVHSRPKDIIRLSPIERCESWPPLIPLLLYKSNR